MRTKHLAWVCCLFAAVSVRAQPSADAGVTKRAPSKPKATRSPFNPITDVSVVVESINSGDSGLPDFFPSHVEKAAVEAVVIRPKVLQGLGSVLIKFKHRNGALSDAEWARLEARATRVPPTTAVVRGFKDGSAGEQLAPDRKQVAHLVVDPKAEDEWNHGESSGVTLLDGDAVIFWYEFW